MFKKMKDLLEMQNKAKTVQKKLESIHIEAEEGQITVIFNAKQEPISFKIHDGEINPKKLEEDLLKACKKGLKKAQEIAATEMKDIMGNLGLPGMPNV